MVGMWTNPGGIVASLTVANVLSAVVHGAGWAARFFHLHVPCTCSSPSWPAGSVVVVTFPILFAGWSSSRLPTTATLFLRAGPVAEAGITSEIVAVLPSVRL